MPKKFSIIIPAWNEAEYVGAAVGACQAQDLPRGEYEIIVVDNNSKDGTSEAARKAGADKVLLETEQGTNSARNCGAKAAEGEILAFLDATNDKIHRFAVTFLRRAGSATSSAISRATRLSRPRGPTTSDIRESKNTWIFSIRTFSSGPCPRPWNSYSGKKRP